MLVNLKSLVIQMHVPRSSNASYSNIRRSPYVPLSQMQFSSSNASYSNIPRSSNQMEVTRIFPVPQMFLVPQMQVTQMILKCKLLKSKSLKCKLLKIKSLVTPMHVPQMKVTQTILISLKCMFLVPQMQVTQIILISLKCSSNTSSSNTNYLQYKLLENIIYVYLVTQQVTQGRITQIRVPVIGLKTSLLRDDIPRFLIPLGSSN